MGLRTLTPEDMPTDFSTRFNYLAGAASLFSCALSAAPLFQGSGHYVQTVAAMTKSERIDVLFKLAALVLIVHAISWVGVERLLNWDYATGPTPKGWRAAVMSLTLTLPAVSVPFVYQAITATRIISGEHARGAVLAACGGAVAYIIIFGVDQSTSPGVRDHILRKLRSIGKPLWAEIAATFAYALILLALVAVPYRLVVLPQSTIAASLGWAILAALLTFFGLSAYLLLKYPSSLDTTTHWGFLRGVIAGIFTVISLCTALYA